jgi:hypothetical protein
MLAIISKLKWFAHSLSKALAESRIIAKVKVVCFVSIDKTITKTYYAIAH